MFYFSGTSFGRAVLHVTLYACCIAAVLGSPMPLGVRPKDEITLQLETGYAVVKRAFGRGQHLVTVLNQIFHTDNMKRHTLLQYCFGDVPKTDIPFIVHNIETLANPQSYVIIQDVIEKMNDKNKGVYAYVTDDGNPWRLTFTEKFHKLTHVDDQAGVVVHEVSHILLKLYDYFEHAAPHKPTFKPNAPNYTGPRVMSGYEHDDFHRLTETAPHVTRFNADSYAVAAIMAGRIEHLQTQEEVINAILKGHAFSTTTFQAPPRPDHLHHKAGPSHRSNSRSPPLPQAGGK